MKCSKCGNAVSGNSRYCNNCGEKLERQSIMPENNNKLYILMIAALTIVILGLIIVLAVINNGNTSDKSVENNTYENHTIQEETQSNSSVISADIDIPTPVPTQVPTPVPTTVPTPVQEETIKSVMFVVACNEYITLRSQPSTSAPAITRIPLGDSVGYISGAQNGFYKVSYNGRTGYALAAYLSNYEPQMTTPYMTVVNCDEWISLRVSPSKSAGRITKIPLGASVEFISTASNGFYKVKYAGTVGYALAEYLR